MAPEISELNANGYTLKADVYSFGVMLGEIICGVPPKNKCAYPKKDFGERDLYELYEFYEKCVQDMPNKRPDMLEIVAELELYYEKLKLKRMQEDAGLMIINIKGMLSNIENNFQVQCTRINNAKEALIEVINERVKTLLNDLQTKKEIQVSTLEKQKQTLEKLLQTYPFFNDQYKKSQKEISELKKSISDWQDQFGQLKMNQTDNIANIHSYNVDVGIMKLTDLIHTWGQITDACIEHSMVLNL